ncbi:7755_t:CDS:2 [Dentiscutata erythropus]|uniref:7755_t:CDS:1 n=1 Tax=Dentiscutata erythropus TaxID=1348616 RepID=A0A9N9EHW9_9GLOM|nr:7755_t:CDS:2 [Dentiscutata erythropus]
MSNVDDQSVNNNPNIINESMDFINKDHERTNSAPLTDFTFSIINEPSNNEPSAPLKNLSRENWTDFNTQSPKLEEKQIYLGDLTMKDQNMLQTSREIIEDEFMQEDNNPDGVLGGGVVETPPNDDNNNNAEHNNYGRENRRWRGRRSQSSHTDNNDKSEPKGHLNLRKLSDAEFQALPSGSRLFLGNLSTHSTSKKELYDIFSPHGEILQISIKNSFGFVQYDNPASVIRAIEKENGLEVSHGKPWHHSSSHEGGFKPSGGNRQGKHWNKKVYKDSWHQNDHRRYDEYDRRPNDYNNRRASYDSRGGNRPPPRDDRKYRRNSYREDHHDERYPHRSKPYRIPSREFIERRQSRDNQYRSQSHDEHDDEFPLPRRQGNDVPECQIIVLEEAERAFRDASISVHTLHLSRKLHIQAVIRQMIVEGVHAVIFMERHLALNGRVNMQIFDQTRLRDNVKYDEAVGLLLRTRITQRPSDFRSPDNLLFGGQPNIPQTQQTHSIGGQPAPTGLNSISLSNVNFAALANLLGTLQQPAAAANPSPNVQPMSIITPGNMQTSQPGSLTQQQPNFDVQQLLRQLSPQNAGIPNPPFITVPSQITSNLGPPPSTFNTSIVGQPTNTITPNSLTPNVIPLTQHQPQHINPNMQQFQTPSNVTDIMSQFKQYSTQR